MRRHNAIEAFIGAFWIAAVALAFALGWIWGKGASMTCHFCGERIRMMTHTEALGRGYRRLVNGKGEVSCPDKRSLTRFHIEKKVLVPRVAHVTCRECAEPVTVAVAAASEGYCAECAERRMVTA